MSTDITVQCSCGAVRGVVRGVSESAGNHCICYCDDCQAFVHHLGRAEEILDGHGGSEIYQTSPARLEITAGRERLACMRLTSKGLFRWHTNCCRTPIGNTASSAQLPFVGLFVFCMRQGAPQGSLDAALGPVKGRVFARFAIGRPPGDRIYDKAPLGMLFCIFARLLAWRLRGDHKRSPFFDPKTGKPVVVPHVIAPR